MNDEQRPADPSPTQPWPPPPVSGQPPTASASAGHPFDRVQTAAPPGRSGPPLAAGLLAVGLVVLVGLIAGYIFFLAGPASPTATPTSVAGSPTASASPTAGGPTATAAATPTGSPGESPTGTPDGSPMASPDESPTTSPGTSPTTSPDASPSGSPVGRTPPPDIAAAINSVTSQIPPMRELDPLRDVPYVLLTRAEATDELRAALDEEVDVDELETEQRLLQRLGLLPDDADLYGLFVELYTASVAAFYRPDTGTFYIIERDEPFGALDRMFVAHEYTHALQDQHFDLEGTRITDNAQGDAQLAQLAAIEGDASLLMYLWAFGNLTPEEQLELFEDMTPTDEELLERMPPILRRQLAFPYNEGFSFSSRVYALGGWERINDTLTDPPASTEQILHPDLYIAGEEPIEIDPDDMLGLLGDGWSRAYAQTMGELNTQIWLADGEEPPLVPLPGQERPWQTAAAGWGGDRLQMYENEAGQWAIVWQTAWDSADDADEFEAAAQPLLGQLDGPALLLPGRGGPEHLTLFVASDEETLAAISNPE